MSSKSKTEFLRRDVKNGQDVFHFVCEACKSEGELKLPHSQGMQPFGCPEGCGATYVRWNKPPELKCVVRPFFVERA